MEFPKEDISGRGSSIGSIDSFQVSQFVEEVIANARKSAQAGFSPHQEILKADGSSISLSVTTEKEDVLKSNESLMVDSTTKAKESIDQSPTLRAMDLDLPAQNDNVPSMGASPDIMITGSENEKSSDIDSAIQKPSCEAGVIDGVDEPAKESVDLKDDLSSVEDAATKAVATEVTQEESVNLAEESMNAVSDVDTVTPQPGLHTTDESTSRNVAVVEMSNAEAKETDLTSTCNDPISVDTAGFEMSSKDGEVVDNTVTADTKYSTQMIQTPCYDQQPKSKDEASTTDEEFKSKEKSGKSTPVVAGEKVQAKKSGKFLNRNKVAPMKEDSVQRNDKPAVKEEPVMVALQNTFYAMDKDKVLTYTGLRDGDDNIILVINPDNISSKTKEEQKSTWIQIREALEKNLPSEKFVMIIKPTMPLKSLKKLYKMMKESFSDQLSSFLLHRPGAKLKTAFYVCRPFLQKKMSKKIFVTNSQSVSGDHGIPRMILRFL